MSGSAAPRVLAVHQGGGVGGAPTSLSTMLAALPSAEWQPEIAFTETGGAVDHARALGVPTCVVRTGGAFYYSAHARLSPRAWGRFLTTLPGAIGTATAFLQDRRPDLVHLNTSVLFAWAIAARRLGIPIVWQVREVLGPDPRLRRWQAEFIVSHARQVIAISRVVAGCFPASAPITVIPNAVDPHAFAPASPAERRSRRAELGLPEETALVVMLGSVQVAKGHWLALDSLALLAEGVPDARLVLLAGGVDSAYRRSWRGRVKRLLGRPMDNLAALLRDADRRGLGGRVAPLGFRTDVAHVLGAMDAVLFPSLQPEGFGRPLIEGMAAELPVVATDVGPSAEILGHDAGLLVPPRSDRVAAALERVLRDRGLAAAMGRAGRERVEACFTPDRQVARVAAVYRAALGARGGRP